MQVLHLISSLDPRAGGPPQALLGLAAAQADLGLNVKVLSTFTASEEPRIAEALREAGIDTELVGPVRRPLGLHPGLSGAIRSLMGENHIVHIHGLWEQIQHVGAVVSRRCGVPYIFRPCGMLDPWSLNQSRVKKRIYLTLRLRRDLNHAAAIHFTTATERDLAKPLRLRPPAIVAPNGVDLSEFDPPPEPGLFRRDYPDVGSRPMVLFLSRVHPKKGVDLLIRAFARADLSDAVLVIAGPGEQGYLDELGDLVKRHHLNSRVLFVGMLHGRHRIEALVDADLFVLPSYQENFGIAVVEALASGTPVLISDQVNIHQEIVGAGVGGSVPLDVSAFGDALGEWMRDANLRQSAQALTKPFVAEHYDWRGIARQWESIYRRYINS